VAENFAEESVVFYLQKLKKKQKQKQKNKKTKQNRGPMSQQVSYLYFLNQKTFKKVL
jgi:hypothetical protein